MSVPLNEEDSAKVLVLEALRTIFDAMGFVIKATQVHEAMVFHIENQPTFNYNFGWSKYNLVELAYLNDSIIPKEKALTL